MIRAPGRRFWIQAGVLAAAGLFLAWLARNVALNLDRLGVRTGFEFLARPAGFDIAQRLVPYSEQSSYLDAFVVALLNTLVLAGVSIVLATLLGFAIGLLRFVRNPLLSFLAAAYVEAVRNVPLLLHLLFWYFAVLQPLPPPRQSLGLFGVVFLNNRGLYLPDLAGNVPQLTGFNFSGGIVVIPEFVAMTVGLSIYGAAFIAEIVRGGVLAVPSGVVEAGRALGLSSWRVATKIIVPLALRAMVPPLGAYYVQLVKNTSLSAAIAYPELMLIFAGTALNQTGQPLEIMIITLAAYLAIGLCLAALTGVVNRRLALDRR